MIRVALTGNIGSGKTTVCKIFETLDIPVFYSDIVAKSLYRRRAVKDSVKRELGDVVFTDDNVDFKKLAGVIFTDKSALNFINGLIHPLVFDEYEKWLRQNIEKSYVIHESAILFENGLEDKFDKIVVVSCPEEIRINRLLKRDNTTVEVIKKRLENQMNDKEKENRADYIIINDGQEFIIPQIVKIDKELRQE